MDGSEDNVLWEGAEENLAESNITEDEYTETVVEV